MEPEKIKTDTDIEDFLINMLGDEMPNINSFEDEGVMSADKGVVFKFVKDNGERIEISLTIQGYVNGTRMLT